MEPRMSKGKKWTALPNDYLKQVQDVCLESFPEQAKRGTFVAEGRIYPQELIFRLGFLEKGRLKQVNFEISILFNPLKENAKEMLMLALDCTASWMEGYFNTEGTEEDESEEYPRFWAPQKLANKEVFLQFSTVNSSLESEADKLLGEKKAALIQDDELDDSEERELVKKVLGIDDVTPSDDDDDSEGGGTTH